MIKYTSAAIFFLLFLYACGPSKLSNANVQIERTMDLSERINEVANELNPFYSHLINKRAPEFHGQTLNGRMFDLTDYIGK